MVKVRGIFDGKNVVLEEPISLPPNTPVEVLIAEEHLKGEDVYWQRLREMGLITEVQSVRADAQPFTPVPVSGAPVSQTIIEERR
jgi:hypothetical protein